MANWEKGMAKAHRAVKAKWAAMSEEERSAEMKRRMRGSRRKKRSHHAKAECPVCHRRFGPKYVIKHLRDVHHLTAREAKRVISNDSEAPATSQPQEGGTTADFSNDISYLYGKVETLCEHYAHSNGIPFTAIAEGLSTLLRHPQGRQVLGADHSVRKMQGRSA